jgi:hypothetical protein
MMNKDRYGHPYAANHERLARTQDKMAWMRGAKSYAEANDDVRGSIDAALAAPIKSADRVVLSDGMRVFTNNLDRGVVDLSRLDYEWHAGERRFVPWFDVVVDTNYKGEADSGKVLQSDDRVAVRHNGKTA